MQPQTRLNIASWNANGLSKQMSELKSFLNEKTIDILLIAETHFTDKSFVSIPNYNTFYTNHPDNKAHGGTAVIIKKTITCFEDEKYCEHHIQATTVVMNDSSGQLKLSAIYCPPKHANQKSTYGHFIKSLGDRFIAGGDFNAKNIAWGSRLTNTKGRNLYDSLMENNCKFLSTGEPTYWPSDPRKQPDLIDFFIYKSINKKALMIQSCLELSSDHSPILLTFETNRIGFDTNTQFTYNRKTCWETYRELIENRLISTVSLKTAEEIDTAIVYLNTCITNAATFSTPQLKPSQVTALPNKIKNLLKRKRKLRKLWQENRSPCTKKELNKATKELSFQLQKQNDEALEIRISNLSATKATNYSLWKATKKVTNSVFHYAPIKKGNSWAKTSSEKAQILADHFSNTFKNSKSICPDTVIEKLNEPNTKIKKISLTEIKRFIREINIKKTAGYDGITGKLIKELPIHAMIFIRNILNSCLKLKYFPKVWKVAEVLPVPKPGKNATMVNSYRPISMLPILSKLFESMIYKRLEPLIQKKNLLPNHQFGFQKHHSTTQQVHRIINKIGVDIDSRKFSVGVFLDVAKAFDSVWHQGLLYKLSKQLPAEYFLLLKSFIEDRHFYVKFKTEFSKIAKIEAGVPQGSILGPVLYLLYTADIPMPTSKDLMIATFADDTGIISSNKDISTATDNLQKYLNEVLHWFNKWGIQINADKTVQVTFTNRKIFKSIPLLIDDKEIRNDTKVKYLGMCIDRKINWKEHILQKKKEAHHRFGQLYWLLCKRSKLSIQTKLLIYKSIIVPIWSYGIEIWGTTCKSNVNIIQRLQNKILRTIVNARWYIPNDNLHKDLNVETVEQLMKRRSQSHLFRLQIHTNKEVQKLPEHEQRYKRRLKRKLPSHVPLD